MSDPNTQDPSPSSQTIEQLQQQLQDQARKIESLEATRVGLLSDMKKKKNVDSFLKAAGIDLADPEFEDRVLGAVSSLRSSPPPAGTQEPQEAVSTPSQPQTPASAVEEAMRAEMASLKNQMKQLAEERDRERREKEKEREERRKEYKKSLVLQELERADCQRPSHLYMLQESNFRLLDDNETIVYGPEENPVSVRDAISKLRDDDEFSIYFRGSGATGSGLASSRQSMPSVNNPFASGTANATQAAKLMQEDPGYARRLMQAARARGELDPVIGKAFSNA